MRPIEEKINRTIRQYALLSDCRRVIVGCSGGADSIALLHYLHTHFDGEVAAAHVNHHLRGEESRRDEQFVREFCEKNQIPLFVRASDVAALAKERRQTIEECGRMVRYDFFQSLIKSETDRIATAHTLSDSVETVLFHLARGTGSRGLRGIPPVRGKIIRPLMGITRQEVEDYCALHHLSYVQDSTNDSLDYTRNRIRHQVIPLLEQIHPGVVQSVGRLTRQMAEQEEALTFYAKELFQGAKTHGGYRIAPLQTAPKGTVLHGLAGLLRQQGAGDSLTEEKLEQLYHCIQKGSGGITVCGHLEVRCERGQLLFLSPEKQCDREEIPCKAPQQFHKLGKVVSVTVNFTRNCKISENNSDFLFPNSLDYDTIPTSAVWRSRRPGDTFRPLGRGVTKTLKHLLQEQNIPPSRRDSLLVLAEGSTLLWAEGLGVSERYAVTSETERIVTIEYKEA